MANLWLQRRRKARAKARLWFIGALVVYFLFVSIGLNISHRVWGSIPSLIPKTAENEKGDLAYMTRVRREAENENYSSMLTGHSLQKAGEGEEGDAKEENCTPRAVNNFPGNFFSLKDTQEGGVVIHILISLYLFAALAVVCDDYFVPALESICEDLGLQEDVAGATFMAAGSSAPELCTSIVGVFIAQSDVGVGTIVGSAVFNILVIVGLCGLCAGMVVHLTWYPLVRDTLFYLLSVLALVLVIEDSDVHWYEALCMLLLYGFYILLMYFNRRLETQAMGAWESFVARWRGGHGGPAGKAEEKERLLAGSEEGSSGLGGSNPSHGEDEEETKFTSLGGSSGEKGAEKEEHQYESPWEIPDSYLSRVYWVAMTPVRALCYVTIPDCRRGGGWRRLYPLTFLLSVVWIGGYTYIMVWMITIAGDALDIPDTVMGLTLLAAGTSLPDCLASVLVARDGYGDMAVSNSIGSNVFDILLCLGLPWLIETAAFKGGDSLEISSSGLLYSSLTLLGTVVFLLVSIAVNRWRLTKCYGVVCLAVYVVVITLSCLYELNIFGDLNPPACPR